MAVLIGTTTMSGGGDFFGAGDIAATRAVAAATGDVDTIKVAVASGSNFTSMKVALYSDTPGASPPSTAVPNAKLGEATISSSTAGVQSVSLSPAVSVVSGTAYWLAVLPLGGQFNFNGGTGLTGYFGKGGQSVMPSTWDTTGNFGDTTANGGIPMSGESTGGGGGASIVSPVQLLGPSYAAQRAASI